MPRCLVASFGDLGALGLLNSYGHAASQATEVVAVCVVRTTTWLPQQGLGRPSQISVLTV